MPSASGVSRAVKAGKNRTHQVDDLRLEPSSGARPSSQSRGGDSVKRIRESTWRATRPALPILPSPRPTRSPTTAESRESTTSIRSLPEPAVKSHCLSAFVRGTVPRAMADCIRRACHLTFIDCRRNSPAISSRYVRTGKGGSTAISPGGSSRLGGRARVDRRAG